MSQKKSAGIVTIYDPIPNYGNRLQNYAVQTIMEKLGFETVTYSFEKEILNCKTKIKYIVQLLTGFHLPGDKLYWQSRIPKAIVFNKFNNEFIKTQKIKSVSDIKDRDYYVLGSDQVWNVAWYVTCSMKKDLFLLTFAKPDQRVCLAPSFGVNQLPDEWKPWFKKNLSDFPMISVREDAGAEIIKELTGKDAEVIIDPTLMIDVDEWKKIAKKPSKADCSKQYILTYFLGGCPESARQDIIELTEKYDLKVYDLMDQENPNLYASDPCGFIYLIAHSRLVLTDSFHACVFSFLFGKPFVIYNRVGTETDMMSRMHTLLDKFGLLRKYSHNLNKDEIFECNYEDGYKQLQAEKIKAYNFLKKSLHIDETTWRI